MPLETSENEFWDEFQFQFSYKIAEGIQNPIKHLKW